MTDSMIKFNPFFNVPRIPEIANSNLAGYPLGNGSLNVVITFIVSQYAENRLKSVTI